MVLRAAWSSEKGAGDCTPVQLGHAYSTCSDFILNYITIYKAGSGVPRGQKFQPIIYLLEGVVLVCHVMI